jgi:hypothetical protein
MKFLFLNVIPWEVLMHWLRIRHKIVFVDSFSCKVDTHLDARNLFDSNAISFYCLCRDLLYCFL